MKTPPSKAIVPLLLLALGAALPVKAQSTKYFDQNGTSPGFGFAADGTGVYQWDNSSLSWNSDIKGGDGTFSAWSGVMDTAVFSSGGATLGYVVQLTTDLHVGHLTLLNNQGAMGTGSQKVLISASTARSITLGSGALITNTAGEGRHLVVGDNVDLRGDFTVVGNGRFSIQGAGPAYSGVITVAAAANGGLAYDVDHRYGASTALVINSGRVAALNAGAVGHFGSLSGAGGHLVGIGGKAEVIIDQATHTTWGGSLGNANNPGGSDNLLDFTKRGVGTLSLVGAGDHYIARGITVEEGALFMTGNLTNASETVVVEEGGTFGGTVVSAKEIVLEGAASELTAGMLDAAGTLTLQKGLTALSGATFNFQLNGDDGHDGTLNSAILLTAGEWDVSGPVTVNLIDLAMGGGFESGPSYTIDLVESWSDNLSIEQWSLGKLPSLWQTTDKPFVLNGNKIQIEFTVIPESRSLLLCSLGMVALLAARSGSNRKKPGTA